MARSLVFSPLGAVVMVGISVQTHAKGQQLPGGLVFRGEKPEDVWITETLPLDDGRWVRAMLTPRETSPRVCRSNALLFELGPTQRLDGKWDCGPGSCRSEHRVYVAIRRTGERTPCNGIPIRRYVHLRTLIEERSLVDLHDLIECIRAFGGPSCVMSVAIEPLTTGDSELLRTLAPMRLDSLDLTVLGSKSPIYYEAHFCTSYGFECGDHVKVIFGAPEDGVVKARLWRVLH